MDKARALVNALCSSCVSRLPVAFATCINANKICYVLDSITLVVHGHGQGTHLGTYLVQW